MTQEVTFIESQDKAPCPYKPGLVIDDAGGMDRDVCDTDDDMGGGDTCHPTVEGLLQDQNGVTDAEDTVELHDIPGNPTNPPGDPIHSAGLPVDMVGSASFPGNTTSGASLPESMMGGVGSSA